jgi:branched-chain amino acid transport system ATP-binding protein
MTVLDNLEMGGLREKDKKKLADNQERVFSIFPKLADLRTRNAGVLSGGERQMLAMGIALMSSPKLILLDEPSAGLAPLIVQQMFGAIGKINREERISFLIVEQSVELVEQITSRVCLLKAGRVLFQGEPAALKHFIEETDLKVAVEN